MRKYKCVYDIEFQNLKEIMDFVAEKYGENTGFIFKNEDFDDSCTKQETGCEDSSYIIYRFCLARVTAT